MTRGETTPHGGWDDRDQSQAAPTIRPHSGQSSKQIDAVCTASSPPPPATKRSTAARSAGVVAYAHSARQCS